MRPGISFTLTAAHRHRLEAIVGNRNASQKHVWRAEIVLLSADGHGNGRDHAPNAEVEDLCMTLAGAPC
jgi:hypothetical protein